MISNRGMELMREAQASKSGQIIDYNQSYQCNHCIIANERHFGRENLAEYLAWLDALNELVREGLVAQVNRNIYRLSRSI